MRSRGIARTTALLAGVLVALVAAPAFGAGFLIYEHGTKATGLAGAFTAQADDPSAMFYNAGGLAFQRERSFLVGTTLISNTTDFDGLGPFPGAGATGELEDNVFYPSHAYWVEPLGGNWTFGLGFNNPFGLTTEWKNPDNWPGRFLATKTVLRTFDLNPTLAWQATPNLGLGFGVVARWSDLELNRRLGLPTAFGTFEVGRATLESDLEEAFGFNVGLLHKVNPSFSWGLQYRSAIEVDYEGDGRFTQTLTGNPGVDGAAGMAIPFGTDLPIETSIEMPEIAVLGLAFGLTPNVVLETDVEWVGWSSFDEVDIRFTSLPPGNPFSQVIPEEYDDSTTYRAGLNWTASPTTQWRFGVLYDETPQPEESVGPLLPDADRTGFTIGYGYTGTWDFDIAFMYLDFEERTRDQSFLDENGQPVDVFHGTYDTTAYLLGLSLGF